MAAEYLHELVRSAYNTALQDYNPDSIHPQVMWFFTNFSLQETMKNIHT